MSKLKNGATRGSIQKNTPYRYGEASPLLDSNLGGGKGEQGGGGGGGGASDGGEGGSELMKSDQHKNKDFQQISGPKSTVLHQSVNQSVQYSYSQNKI